MSPTDLHSALVAKVTEYLNIAEAAEPGPWAVRLVPPYTDPLLLHVEPGCENVIGTVNVEYEEQAHIAAHDPSFAILVHRQALETLNRHRPGDLSVTQLMFRLPCIGCGPTYRAWEDCPEVAGVRAIYLSEASE